jgi:hypothetical protein
MTVLDRENIVGRSHLGMTPQQSTKITVKLGYIRKGTEGIN